MRGEKRAEGQQRTSMLHADIYFRLVKHRNTLYDISSTVTEPDPRLKDKCIMLIHIFLCLHVLFHVHTP